MTIGEGGFCF